MKISRTQLRETVKAILSEMPMATGDSPLEGYLKDRLGADIAGILMDGVSRLMPEDQMRLQELAKQMVVNEQQCGNRGDSGREHAEIELEQIIRMLVERGYDPQEIMSIVEETIEMANYDEQTGIPSLGGPENPYEKYSSREPMMEKGMSGDDMRRHVEKDMGLPPGSIKSQEELEQAEKERKEKLATMPKNKVAPKPRPKKPYGGGSKYRPYGRST